jgi:hypothetical protein
MINWTINAFQGQWHKLFGHPMDAVLAEKSHQAGFRKVVFTCKECGRSFLKQIPCINCDRR